MSNGYADRNLMLLDQLKDPTQHREAYESLVNQNIKLVQSVASRYVGYVIHDLSFEDLVNEGVIGLMRAIEKFDPSHNTMFSTYAVHWIRQSIARAIWEKGTRVRIPIHMAELIQKVTKEEAMLSFQEEEFSKEHVCQSLGIKPEQYERAKIVEHLFLSFISLNQHVIHEDQDSYLGELITQNRMEMTYFDEDLCDPALLIEREDVRARINETIDAHLTSREKNVLQRRLGFVTGECETLEEIGQGLGVTRERVRQIESKAISKLRFRMAHRPARDDFEWPDLISG